MIKIKVTAWQLYTPKNDVTHKRCFDTRHITTNQELEAFRNEAIKKSRLQLIDYVNDPCGFKLGEGDISIYLEIIKIFPEEQTSDRLLVWR